MTVFIPILVASDHPSGQLFSQITRFGLPASLLRAFFPDIVVRQSSIMLQPPVRSVHSPFSRSSCRHCLQPLDKASAKRMLRHFRPDCLTLCINLSVQIFAGIASPVVINRKPHSEIRRLHSFSLHYTTFFISTHSQMHAFTPYPLSVSSASLPPNKNTCSFMHVLFIDSSLMSTPNK